ncbi:MAG: EamA family transporter [Tistrella sp.]|uniref:EamA family transporter n=1 Tax=Tistrella mobilis TaxID=171437 RepID=A0A3B9IP99_9PROT|nr:DMT family transporter [Tistrella sp.]MAD37241.1 EamA family transporter [Tistrella sp.]MBA77896.1 EamA family transporter [Tistrella sp.]HAE49694.1 EamA family transporter [Tistrella mobilis]
MIAGDRPRIIGWTVVAMIAFAANSVLCRWALDRTAIDPAAFTGIRLAAGAVMLWLCLRAGRRTGGGVWRGFWPGSWPGSWAGAAALSAYAAAFSFAYVGLPAASGALLLFGAVQVTMIAAGLIRGERLRPLQWLGIMLAAGGLVALLAPGVQIPDQGAQAPDPIAAVLMLASGAAWGAYSLIGRRSRDPLATTAGNFMRSLPLAVLLLVPALLRMEIDLQGVALAVASGAVASGLGYAVWYAVLPALGAAQAASVQLSVPVIAALGGTMLLGEAITWHLVVVSVAVLGGIALVIRPAARG